MSHVETIKMKIQDLEALARAAQDLGCVLKLNAERYKSYRGEVKCLHKIALKVPGPNTHEIGVFKEKGGGFSIKFDSTLVGIRTNVGHQCKNLLTRYHVQVARKAAALEGYNVTERTLKNGKVQLELVKI